MSSKLKNYTSTIPSDKSTMQIERELVKVGASHINRQYENETLIAMTFLITIRGNTVCFKLPAKVETVFKVLWDEVKRPREDTKQRIREQSERTAWKILLDWVQAQCAMIRLEQAEVGQMFLPYVYDPKSDVTLWERIQSGELKLLE